MTVVASVPRALSELNEADLAVALQGEPAYRRAQLWEGLFRSTAPSLERIHPLPRRLRASIAMLAPFTSLAVQREEVSLDGTRKALFATADGAAVEAVCLPSERGAATTVCVSSQAGCGLACAFCATGALGLTRSLSAGEIVDQFLHYRRTLSGVSAPNRVVFMGMGEPLANLPRVREAVAILTDPARVGLGARHVTVSTVGLPAGIRALAQWPVQIGLAISLHAPVDDIRSRLAPLNRRFPLADLMDASRAYQRCTGRRVSYEYTMLAGVNDTPELARALGNLVAGQRCHVNLIPFNPYPGASFTPSPREAIRRFRDTLRTAGVAATVRRTRGRDIAGACGQLHAGRLAGPLPPA